MMANRMRFSCRGSTLVVLLKCWQFAHSKGHLDRFYVATNMFCFPLINKCKTALRSRERRFIWGRGAQRLNRCRWRAECRASVKASIQSQGNADAMCDPPLLHKYKFTIILLLLWVSAVSQSLEKHWAHWEVDGRWKTCLLSVPEIPGRRPCWSARTEPWII